MDWQDSGSLPSKNIPKEITKFMIKKRASRLRAGKMSRFHYGKRTRKWLVSDERLERHGKKYAVRTSRSPSVGGFLNWLFPWEGSDIRS